MVDGRRRGNRRIRFRPPIPLLLITTAVGGGGCGDVAATGGADAADPAATARTIGHIAAARVELRQLSVRNYQRPKGRTHGPIYTRISSFMLDQYVFAVFLFLEEDRDRIND